MPIVAELVGSAVGVDRVLAERSPEDKVEAVLQARASGTTIMVGDGINDAPALSHARVGIAMGAAGATASSEAADVVIAVDRRDRVPAERLRTLDTASARAALDDTIRFLNDELLPTSSGRTPTSTRCSPRRPGKRIRPAEEITEVQWMLYDLHTIMRLHNAQEEEV
jgi:hypothetical protein